MMIVIINNHKDKEITSSSMVITTGIKKMPEKMTIHTLQQRQSLREVRTATEEVEEGTKVVTTINISLPEAELEVWILINNRMTAMNKKAALLINKEHALQIEVAVVVEVRITTQAMVETSMVLVSL